MTCPRPSVLSKSAEHLLLSCQDPVPKALPQLPDSLFCLFSSATSMQTSIVLAMHSSCASFCSFFFFWQIRSFFKARPTSCFPQYPRPLTPGIVLRACYLMIALLLILATSWKKKIFEEVTSWHTGGGDNVFFEEAGRQGGKRNRKDRKSTVLAGLGYKEEHKSSRNSQPSGTLVSCWDTHAPQDTSPPHKLQETDKAHVIITEIQGAKKDTEWLLHSLVDRTRKT